MSEARGSGEVAKSIPHREWPPRFHCHVPGTFAALAGEGYGLILLPLYRDLEAIARRAIELDDPVLLGTLLSMGMVTEDGSLAQPEMGKEPDQ